MQRMGARRSAVRVVAPDLGLHVGLVGERGNEKVRARSPILAAREWTDEVRVIDRFNLGALRGGLAGHCWAGERSEAAKGEGWGGVGGWSSRSRRRGFSLTSSLPLSAYGPRPRWLDSRWQASHYRWERARRERQGVRGQLFHLPSNKLSIPRVTRSSSSFPLRSVSSRQRARARRSKTSQH